NFIDAYSLRGSQFYVYYLINHFNVYFFFFSSRRRHTRSKRDWSSDVCCSDLDTLRTRCEFAFCQIRFQTEFVQQLEFEGENGLRSEERRVGKECRFRWGR